MPRNRPFGKSELSVNCRSNPDKHARFFDGKLLRTITKLLTLDNKRCHYLDYRLSLRRNLRAIHGWGSKQGKLCLFARVRNPQLAIISAENGNGGPVLFPAAAKFHFPPFPFSATAPATTAFYPICQRYKLILISGLAHASFLGREGRVGFIGIRVTRLRRYHRSLHWCTDHKRRR